MARYFQISSTGTKDNKVTLDSQGRGSVQYTVKNVTGAPIDGRAVLVSVPANKPPSGPVESGWVKIVPPTDRHFDQQEEQFVVKIEVPQKDRSKVGTYTFRLDAVLVTVPDRGDEGPVMAFEVVAAAAKKPNMLAWLIPVIVVVVIAVGVGIWLASRGGGGKVPDVTGKSVADAAAALTADKYVADSTVTTADSDASNANKVISTDPAAGTKAPEGATVHLTVGAAQTSVPMLVGQTLEQAQTLLAKANLAVGNVKNVANPNFSGDVVSDQSQPAGKQLVTNSSVDLTVTPKTVTVPAVTGKLLTAAIQQLRASNLQLGNVYCDQVGSPIVNQSPAANTPAPIGSPVNVYLPCLNRPPAIFLQRGTLAQRSAVVGALGAK